MFASVRRGDEAAKITGDRAALQQARIVAAAVALFAPRSSDQPMAPSAAVVDAALLLRWLPQSAARTRHSLYSLCS
ncbi:hypothetical protein TYRP_019064 [Tyrophagus putrescentiae]|nr:hypothetical protein TYRP_019064 [Tyrophagus putrescentiae]